MSRQIYYETVISGLVKVCNVRRDDDPCRFIAEAAETRAGYVKGRTIIAHRRHFVRKAGTRNGFQMVYEVQPTEL